MDFTGFDNWLGGYAGEGLFSGVVEVRRKGSVLYQGAYGLANRSFDTPVTGDTRFAIASVTKMFTSVAILKLVESGRISLDDSVASFLAIADPAIPGEVTVHHLLTHTSGIGDYLDENGTTTDELADVWESVPNYSMKGLKDFLPLVLSKPVKARPGTEWCYCNSGFILLGLILEAITGCCYFHHVRDTVLVPAGMANSGFFGMDAVVPGLAEGYIPLKDCTGKPTGWQRNIFAVTAPASDGGLVSTARDLAAFMKALREGLLLGQEMTAHLLSTHRPTSPAQGTPWHYGYGMGFIVDPTDSGNVVRYGHRGEDPGVSAAVFHYPVREVDVVILGNQTGCVAEPLARLHGMLTE